MKRNATPSYLINDRYTIQLPRSVRGIDQSLVAVRRFSPLIHRRAVERFAYYFKREFRYDFPQFEAEDVTDDYRAWLFASHDYSAEWRPFGAACFRYRRYEGGDKPVWALQWIWLHPYFREGGHLKKAWPLFIKALGEPVDVEPPYSRAMVAFLGRADPNTLTVRMREAIGSGEPLRLAKRG